MRDFAYFPLLIAALLVAAIHTAAPAQATGVTFHFYGADDCPPCVAFKRDGLPVVEQSASAAGYLVSANMIAKTRDVPTIGAYGATDPVLRLAAERLDRVYPPIFFVTRGGRIHSVHGHDWRAAMQSAEIAAQSTTN